MAKFEDKNKNVKFHHTSHEIFLSKLSQPFITSQMVSLGSAGPGL